MRIVNECSQKWWRLSSWYTWVGGVYTFRPLYRKLQNGHGFAIGPIMFLTKK